MTVRITVRRNILCSEYLSHQSSVYNLFCSGTIDLSIDVEDCLESIYIGGASILSLWGEGALAQLLTCAAAAPRSLPIRNVRVCPSMSNWSRQSSCTAASLSL